VEKANCFSDLLAENCIALGKNAFGFLRNGFSDGDPLDRHPDTGADVSSPQAGGEVPSVFDVPGRLAIPCVCFTHATVYPQCSKKQTVFLFFMQFP